MNKTTHLGQSKDNQIGEEAQYVEKAIQGDMDAFESLYKMTHKRLLMFCWRMSRNESLAEEIVQESYIKAWQALSDFRKESQFYTWLRKIASRLVIDRLRLKAEKVWQNQTELDVDSARYREQIGKSIDLERQIGALPDGARNVLVMHDIEGYSHREISQMMEIAEGTSKAQLARARKLIKAQLADSQNSESSESQNANSAQS